MTEEIMQLALQGGALGVLVIVLWLMFKERKDQRGTLQKMIERDINSREANTVALTKLSDSIRGLNQGCVRVQEKYVDGLVSFDKYQEGLAKTLERMEKMFEKYPPRD